MAIDQKLAAVIDAARQRPDWYDAWQLLDSDSSEEHRLRVYQAVRDDGSLPPEASFYLVAWQTDAVTCERGQIELHDLDEQLHAVLEAHGLDENDSRFSEKAPPEYKRLLQELEQAWDVLYLQVLKEYGEEEMVHLYGRDRAEFDRLFEAGRRYFHGRSGFDGRAE